ncbi:MAG: PIN domain-containing protein [Verrucomicrobia bacterium]|nr:PIN domain-containing protein [Verrucomicrobiota bacterium]
MLIAAERGRFDLPGYFQAHSSEEFFLAAIPWSELHHGVHRAADPARKQRRQRWLSETTANLAVLPFARAEAEKHAEVWADLESRGLMIGPHDLLIAATALCHNHSVATLNEREFARVPGLQLAEIAPFKR